MPDDKMVQLAINTIRTLFVSSARVHRLLPLPRGREASAGE